MLDLKVTVLSMYVTAFKCDTRRAIESPDFLEALRMCRFIEPDFEPLYGYSVEFTESESDDEITAKCTPFETAVERIDQAAKHWGAYWGHLATRSQEFHNDLVEYAHSNPGVQPLPGAIIEPNTEEDGRRSVHISNVRKPENVTEH